MYSNCVIALYFYLVARRQEGVKANNQVRVALEQCGNSVDNSWCVNAENTKSKIFSFHSLTSAVVLRYIHPWITHEAGQNVTTGAQYNTGWQQVHTVSLPSYWLLLTFDRGDGTLTSETWIPSWCRGSHCRPGAGCQTAVSPGPGRREHLPPSASETAAAAADPAAPVPHTTNTTVNSIDQLTNIKFSYSPGFENA